MTSMQTQDLVSFMTQALYLVLWLSLPPIAVAAIVGTLFSLLQALTQVQEQTLSFAVKLIAVFATLMLAARWISAEIYNFTIAVFDAFHRIH
ncbi:EscS/YscS/HrcS family type III secretion system export apparatus protein [Bordetella parapertussis]|uniref:Type III secretion protein n=6 Tax=Bordetella TaxID=517 RepID=K0MD66_BORPB|nr:EscS/YscS/HrcS family type III secretion system export apparatus protein [Bordetella bronchiseptica]AWP63127.1 EscS/YscS/HrcS family type III secretion system export apparatus protein [Bordetella parapertussis]KAK65152.1 type III secretion protein, HrpO family [Bordetella bronchiseptica 980-2]KAK65940.1 type III secretion protein, HrpO family [Bordetella bronchiseptica MO211]KAK74565.1 type III secretion protein, HrpO family [Bordetella bronchiseptica CA90 BB02]KCV24487.1 type III secretion